MNRYLTYGLVMAEGGPELRFENLNGDIRVRKSE